MDYRTKGCLKYAELLQAQLLFCHLKKDSVLSSVKTQSGVIKVSELQPVQASGTYSAVTTVEPRILIQYFLKHSATEIVNIFVAFTHSHDSHVPS